MIWSDMLYYCKYAWGIIMMCRKMLTALSMGKTGQEFRTVYWDYYRDDIRDYEKMLGLFDYHVKGIQVQILRHIIRKYTTVCLVYEISEIWTCVFFLRKAGDCTCLVKLIWEYISKMPMTGKRKNTKEISQNENP